MTVRAKTQPTLETLLKRAKRKGIARVKSKDGYTFLIIPEHRKKSPLEVKGIDLGLTRTEIVQFIHEGRKTK